MSLKVFISIKYPQLFQIFKFLNKKRYYIMFFLKNYWRPKKVYEINSIMKNFKKNGKFFIQIGANDGISGDFLKQFIIDEKVKGVMIEPVPYIYKMLKKNLKESKNIIFENIAISDVNGVKDFFIIKEEILNETPYDVKQLCSFRNDIIEKHFYMHKNLMDNIEKIKVKCLTFNDLIRKHKIVNLDLLVIDTEGYDAKIIKTINFKK